MLPFSSVWHWHKYLLICPLDLTRLPSRYKSASMAIVPMDSRTVLSLPPKVGQSFNEMYKPAADTNTDTSSAPTFALGDSSGVNTAISFVIILLDTTTNNRVLHYAQADFKADGDKTGIASSSQPALSYKAPGTLGESGSRQYSFLMYEQNGDVKLPSAGQNFDAKQFESSNGLNAALAGISMNVDTGSGSGSGQQTTAAASTLQQSTTQEASGTTESTASATPPPGMTTDTTVTTMEMTQGDTAAVPTATPQSLPPMGTSPLMTATDGGSPIMPGSGSMSSDMSMAQSTSMTLATSTVQNATGGAATASSSTSPSRAVSTSNDAVSRLKGPQVVMWTLLGLAVRYHY